MKAAIYARKSNDDNDKGHENKSVTRQIEQSKQYAAKKGWTIDERNIYMDDGMSGAEYLKRSGLQKMLADLKDFDVVVASENSRIGREMKGNAYVFNQFQEHDIELYFYLTDEKLKYNTAIDELTATLSSFASQMELERIAQRTRDALESKAKKGYSTGGTIYGYDNVWVHPDGREVIAVSGQLKPLEFHTEHKINEEQSGIINKIFTMYADGFGISTIAKTLNKDSRFEDNSNKYFGGIRIPSPSRGSGSWAPSSIRAILHNERYIGKITFGKVKKTRKNGKSVRLKQDKSLWQHIDAPQLRIIPDSLWKQARVRSESVKKTYIRNNDGTLWGRPGAGLESRYLLTGLAHCSICGSNITSVGGRYNTRHYGCSYHRNRGNTVCENNHRMPMKKFDDAVLGSIENILTPDVITYTIDLALKKIKEQQKSDPNKPKRLEKELSKQQRELDRFMVLIAQGNAPTSIMEQIQIREQRIEQLKTELNLATLEQPEELDLRKTKDALIERLKLFKELIYSDIPRARQALRKLLDGHIIVKPVLDKDGKKGFSFEGNTQLGVLIDPRYIEVVPRRGLEPPRAEAH